MTNTIQNRMKKLVDWLNERTKEYDNGTPTVSDKEWDDEFFKLVAMEEEEHYFLPNSPSQKVVWESVSELKKIKHNHPMLSLAKTKEVSEVKEFIGDSDFIAMCKMDGLTCSLRYVGGKLVSAETRGNGEIGEDILHNAVIISNIPNYISYIGELVIDGEIICDLDTFSVFDVKNGGDYKNARNFASGKIRMLDARECAKGQLSFIAWDIIKGFDDCNYLHEKLDRLDEYGFTTVPFIDNGTDIEAILEQIKITAKEMYYPIDGVVFKFDDINEYQSKGKTDRFYLGGIIFNF